MLMYNYRGAIAPTIALAMYVECDSSRIESNVS